MINTSIIFSIELHTTTQFLLKRAAEKLSHLSLDHGILSFFEKPATLPMSCGFLCYAISVCNLVGLCTIKIPVSSAYPYQALGYILVMIYAVVIFHETMTLQKIIGVLLITAGVLCIAQQVT